MYRGSASFHLRVTDVNFDSLHNRPDDSAVLVSLACEVSGIASSTGMLICL